MIFTKKNIGLQNIFKESDDFSNLYLQQGHQDQFAELSPKTILTLRAHWGRLEY